MVDRPTGKITDEGVARLRARIGVPEPWPMPPHYKCRERRRVPTRGRGVRRRQPAVVRSELRREDDLGWADRAAGDGRAATRSSARTKSPRSPEDKRDLMKGDPLRGVHAFYSASAREWWAPLRPDHRVFRRNAAVAALDKPSEFAGRAIHEWTANVFQADDGTILSGQYRLMIRTERERARRRRASTPTSSSVATKTKRSRRSTRSTSDRLGSGAVRVRASGKTSRLVTRSARW